MWGGAGTARLLIVGIGLATLLASCAFGVTTPATNVTDSSALLTGVVRNTITGPTDFWFDYGHTSAYGSST
ncbi:MAG: hypothetical protein QOF28_534, partial [Actinomycetota bacterium]|nr:hypothetical protein [Actinomycetota bacterium]